MDFEIVYDIGLPAHFVILRLLAYYLLSLLGITQSLILEVVHLASAPWLAETTLVNGIHCRYSLVIYIIMEDGHL